MLVYTVDVAGMAKTIHHQSLDAMLLPSISIVNEIEVEHFKGIQCGTIPKRFARSILKDSYSGQILDCTRSGCASMTSLSHFRAKRQIALAVRKTVLISVICCDFQKLTTKMQRKRKRMNLCA
jgi:hypothetical protein